MSSQIPQKSASPPDDGGQSPGLVRFLKIAVAGMGLLIVLGLGAVIWRIVQLASSPKPVPAGAAVSSAPANSAAVAAAVLAPEILLELPAGAAVRSVTMSGGRMAVHYDAPSGTGIAVIDLETGRTVSRVRIGGP
jgi:hypothetical protein